MYGVWCGVGGGGGGAVLLGHCIGGPRHSHSCCALRPDRERDLCERDQR